MNNANFEFNMNQQNPWANLSIGAKVATVLVGLTVAAAGLAASIFLAGAALFGALVMMVYTTLSGRKSGQQDDGIIEGEAREVEPEQASSPQAATQ